jgi:DNA-binding NarL/FixJ family response regulator
VVLLAVGLSGGDGLLLARRLQRTSPRPKILVFSGRGDPCLLQRPQTVASKKLRSTTGALRKHLSNIRRKLGLQTTAGLKRYAVQLGKDL